ncbi:unnamed protein product [Brassica rapa subsp. trilocularis]
MGGFFSVPLSGDQVLKDVSYLSCFKASHIKILEENLAAMQRDMEEHKVSHTDVLRRVEREEDTGSMQRLAEVKMIDVERCPTLRKLPLSSGSCLGGDELVISYSDDEWIERVQWEDKATEERFLLCCEKVWSYP